MVDFRSRTDRVLKHCTKQFGEPVMFYPAKGGAYEIRGIFDHEYVTVDPDTEQQISANQPALGVNLNDLPLDIEEGDLFKIRNLTYKVVDNREDGQGGATILLHRKNDNEKVYKRRLG